MREIKTLNKIQELTCEYNKYTTIIIYGYKGIGECVQEFFMYSYNMLRSSDYNGRVKYFATSYQNYETTEGTKEVKGIPIYYIGELQEYSKSALVIVATREYDQKDVLELLDTYRFENIVCVSKELYTRLKIENRKIAGELRLEVMNYSLNHQNKVELLRAKVEKGLPVKVIFLSHSPSTFGCKSLYHAMEESETFEPYIMPFERKERVFENWKELLNDNERFFRERGYRVLSAYEDDYFVDLEKYEPDILFIDYPNYFLKAGTTQLRNEILNWKYLMCYVPYGCLMANSFYYHYEALNIREFWKVFLDTKYSYKRSISEAEFNAGNTVLAGYPKLDDYFEEKDKLDIPEKINNGKKVVIYAPHWSLGMSNNYATFDLYYDYFLRLVKNNPDINFVYKPHPLLEGRIHRLNEQKEFDAQIKSQYNDLMTVEEYREYVETWDSLPNGVVVTKGDYIDLFRGSSCLITDCGSFIGEYLLSGNPCIYLVNPKKSRPFEQYTEVAKKILQQYYLCYTKEEVETMVNEVVLEGNDYKEETRKKVVQSDFVNVGNAGSFICKYLENVLKG